VERRRAAIDLSGKSRGCAGLPVLTTAGLAAGAGRAITCTLGCCCRSELTRARPPRAVGTSAVSTRAMASPYALHLSQASLLLPTSPPGLWESPPASHPGWHLPNWAERGNRGQRPSHVQPSSPRRHARHVSVGSFHVGSPVCLIPSNRSRIRRHERPR
jgi:hypothetical protein